MEHLSRILSRDSFGLVLRVFAGKLGAVETQCDRTLETARKAAAMEIGGKPVFKHILIMVAADTRRVDHDCGQSYRYLSAALKAQPCKQIKVINADREDLFCGILNRSAAELLRHGCSYMGVFSHAAHDYLDLEFMESAAEAFQKGALAAGLAITELQDSIMRGLLANTGMIWDLKTLVSVGGFDHFAEQPFTKGHRDLFTDERQVTWIQGKRDGDKDAYYPRAGVEEIISLIRIARKVDRPCLAPIMPSSGKVWVAPTEPTERKRHDKKMATKNGRQAFMAGHVNADLGVLEDAVMDGYGWKA